jgi:hypothetical protein
VHAVANDDSLPLLIAEKATMNAVTGSQVVAAGDIVKYLKKLGASRTIMMINTTG